MNAMTKTCQLVCIFAAVFSTGCEAAKAADSLAIVRQRAEAKGYRLREVRWDPVLQQRWAVLESVAHPERPLLSELTDYREPRSGGQSRETGSAVTVAPIFTPVKLSELAVRSGDRVTLWSVDENLRMEMSAVALGNAAVGDSIQLRVIGAGLNGDAGWRVSGIVRAAGNVEWER